MIFGAVVWWASLIGAVVLAIQGQWVVAIVVFVVGNIVFRLARGSAKAKTAHALRNGVQAFGYNDGTPAQAAKAERAYRLLALQSNLNSRHVIYPSELDRDVADWGVQSRSTETPILLAVAWFCAVEQCRSSAALWGIETALDVETDGMPKADMAASLRNAFPDWYAQNSDPQLPALVNQRLHAYTFMLLAFAIDRKSELVA